LKLRSPVTYIFIFIVAIFTSLEASNLVTNATYIPKIMEYATDYKTNNACRIGIVYDPQTIEEAILLKKYMQYKTLPKRSLVIKLIAYKQFSRRKAVSLDAVYLFTIKENVLQHARNENVIVFAHKKQYLNQGALMYIAHEDNNAIIFNKDALKKSHQSFSSSFLKFVEPFYD